MTCPSRKAGWLAWCWSALVVVPCSAQQPAPPERVTIAPVIASDTSVWERKPTTELAGRVRQFDAQYLIMLGDDGKSTKIDSARVQSIHIDWQAEQVLDALELVREHRYREAVPALDAARKTGMPVWRQRFMVASLVQCADALGNPRTAGTLFLNLADASPPAMLYAGMPLCWTSREPDQLLRERAVEWMASSKEPARLLGASWLLLGERGPQAKRMLQELQAADNQTVATLAVAQSWRVVPPPQTLQRLPDWIAYRDRLIEPLQIGPTEFLADRLLRVRETDLAIGQLLRIATIHGDRYHRAARALKTAAELMVRQGREEEAKRLQPWIDQLTGS